MNPLVLFSATGPVAARLGPWLGRVAKATPAVVPTLVTKLRAGGAILGDGVAGVLKYFKSSPAAASLTVASLASVGVDVKDLFGDDDYDEETQQYIDNLDRVSNGSTARERAGALKIVLEAASESEEFTSGLSGTRIERLATISVLSFARGHYGSVQAALRAHGMHQAFFEMSRGDVEDGFQTLKLN